MRSIFPAPLVALSAALLLSASLISCAPQPPAPAPAPVVQTQRPRPLGIVYAGVLTGKDGEPLTGHDIRNTPPFSTAWRALLRRSGKIRETWLIRFDAPKTPVRMVTINGAEYMRVEGCKAGACAANSVVVLYSEKEKATYALLKQNGERIWLGEPPDEIIQAYGQMEKQDAGK